MPPTHFYFWSPVGPPEDLKRNRHVKQSFKGKSFSNKENNSKPTPDNVIYECPYILNSVPVYSHPAMIFSNNTERQAHSARFSP